MTVTILGVRHHGPGSARAVRAALHAIDPGIVLVEGPPEADALVRYVNRLVPPVAVLAHAAGGRAAFWPFADFSPEWQALRFASRYGKPVSFIDLPASAVLGNPASSDRGEKDAGEPASQPEPDPAAESEPLADDPLGWLSRAAGHDDPERWWEDVVEHRLGGDPLELFAAIAEAMTELRCAAEADGGTAPRREQRREAAMRQGIRAAMSAGHKAIAVVCGAWHVPALTTLPPARGDAELLRGLPRTKISATWVPWSAQRLTYASGYGAGIASPGWYAHLWQTGDHITERWVARVASLLRESDLPASPASAVETVRLAEAIAAMRGRSLPGLSELNDAALAVLCQGDDVPLRLIHGKLVVGDELGSVPDDVPTVPLQADFDASCRRLRFRPTAVDRQVELDLRKETDLGRSRLLHRLRLLGIGWGELASSTSTGTFREGWMLSWRPEYVVALIEHARFGTTVESAATAVVVEQAADISDFPRITTLVEAAVLADLPDALPAVTAALESRSARTGDIAHLMAAMPPLARVLRYGSVRRADTDLVRGVLDSILVRVCAGLAAACASLDADAAAAMLSALEDADGAIALVGTVSQAASWRAALRAVADLSGTPGLVAGRCARLLLDCGQLSSEQAQQRLARSLSADVSGAVSWLEGFLRGSGSLLLRDEDLWGLLDVWLSGLTGEAFDTALPLLRRAFSQFTQPERRQMATKVRAATPPRHGHARESTEESDDWDIERARRVLDVVLIALGGRVPDE